MAEKKANIQNLLKENLGILVDAPKQGTGNTIDGNIARKFFNNIDIVSRVTGQNNFEIAIQKVFMM